SNSACTAPEPAARTNPFRKITHAADRRHGTFFLNRSCFFPRFVSFATSARKSGRTRCRPASSWTQEPFQDGKIGTREDVRFLRSAPRHFHCKGILPRISTEWLADISVSRYRRDRRSDSATARTATGVGEIRRCLFGHGANPAVWTDGLTRHFCAG